mmetsp:Transcript_145412/g.205867  ORF Transcript_145412/g.205867 Transcript_145412/m.205867 type:complete len:318 (-) Transcript_145412:131-1084(-)
MLRLWAIASALALCSGESLPEDVLEFNDECAEGSCALNALQHRRQPNASEEEHAYGSEEEVIQAFKEKEAVPPGSPKWIECDPLCPEMPAPSDSSDSLGAGPEEDDLGSMGLWHAGANCWYRCHGAGSCSGYCGPGNSCCRWHARYDPPACRSVRWWPVIHWHTCVATSHHSPSPPPSSSGSGSDSCANRAAMGDVITVYHQTGCNIGPQILRDGFRLGHSGWCGGGIYFARSPDATTTKAIGPDSHKGFMIEARVRVGNVAYGDHKCKINGQSLQGQSLLRAGYDSIEFDPGDGQEVIVYCSSQVISTRQYPWKCS